MKAMIKLHTIAFGPKHQLQPGNHVLDAAQAKQFVDGKCATMLVEKLTGDVEDALAEQKDKETTEAAKKKPVVKK